MKYIVLLFHNNKGKLLFFLKQVNLGSYLPTGIELIKILCDCFKIHTCMLIYYQYSYGLWFMACLFRFWIQLSAKGLGKAGKNGTSVCAPETHMLLALSFRQAQFWLLRLTREWIYRWKLLSSSFSSWVLQIHKYWKIYLLFIYLYLTILRTLIL